VAGQGTEALAEIDRLKLGIMDMYRLGNESLDFSRTQTGTEMRKRTQAEDIAATSVEKLRIVSAGLNIYRAIWQNRPTATAARVEWEREHGHLVPDLTPAGTKAP
jgi:hypothetical protein